MTMIGGGGLAELEGTGVGSFGVKAMPRGCPATEVAQRIDVAGRQRRKLNQKRACACSGYSW